MLSQAYMNTSSEYSSKRVRFSISISVQYKQIMIFGIYEGLASRFEEWGCPAFPCSSACFARWFVY